MHLLPPCCLSRDVWGREDGPPAVWGDIGHLQPSRPPVCSVSPASGLSLCTTRSHGGTGKGSSEKELQRKRQGTLQERFWASLLYRPGPPGHRCLRVFGSFPSLPRRPGLQLPARPLRGALSPGREGRRRAQDSSTPRAAELMGDAPPSSFPSGDIFPGPTFNTFYNFSN